MPSNGVRSLFKEISRSGVICTSVNKVNLRIAFRSPGCRMDVVPTEVTTKSKRVFDWDVCKVLVAERYNFLLGDKEGSASFPCSVCSNGSHGGYLNLTSDSSLTKSMAILTSVPSRCPKSGGSVGI